MTILFLVIPFGLFAVEANQYLVVISIDGLRYDYFHRDSLQNIQKMQDNGVNAYSLQPVFPTTYYPNFYSLMTGLYSENHGIISNYFINPFTKRNFNMSDFSRTKIHWYYGETFWQTARKYNIKSAIIDINSYDTIDSGNPDYSINSHNKSIYESMNEIDEFLTADDSKRPHFIYFRYDKLDNIAHKYGLESYELNKEMHNIDSAIGLLNSLIITKNLQDSVNIILLSPHGMSDFNSRNTINITEILHGYDYSYQNYGAYTMINADEDKVINLFLKLKQKQNHFRVFTKNNIPKHLHFSNNPFVSPLLLVADNGWLFSDSSTNGSLQYLKATHGYDNKILNMHGNFVAYGPVFKKGLKTQTLLNVDLYPLFCKIFGIIPREMLDGKLERIGFILKGN